MKWVKRVATALLVTGILLLAAWEKAQSDFPAAQEAQVHAEADTAP